MKMVLLQISNSIFLLFFLFPRNAAAQRCTQGTLRTHYGIVLKGHVIHSFYTEKLAVCYSACNTNLACQSLNFNLADKTCEFNSEFNRSRPESLEKSEVHVYAENPDRGEYKMLIISHNYRIKSTQVILEKGI